MAQPVCVLQRCNQVVCHDLRTLKPCCLARAVQVQDEAVRSHSYPKGAGILLKRQFLWAALEKAKHVRVKNTI